MAERIKDRMLEHKVVDLIAGPDAYRDLPRLISLLDSEESSEKAMNV
jgi:tRNA-2-methylthio-N6-dimethylallyladenosine synthase